MLKINSTLTAKQLLPQLRKVWELSAAKIHRLEKRWRETAGAPVFTVKGKYTARGWTEWTQGFQYGSALLQFDATDDLWFFERGRSATVQRMASHVSHIGVHDHGFNNISTYGNLLRLMREGRIDANGWERSFYELALKVSGAIQAARWTQLSPDLGYIYSFNGPHSLFCDTMRSLRSLAVSHQLGHRLMGERDLGICLLTRLLQHVEATARFNVYFGQGRDAYDIRGRVAHESIFNVNDRSYRCPGTQQGYSPFSTWTRGQAWILCGAAEQLEFLAELPAGDFPGHYNKAKAIRRLEEMAGAVADFWLERTPTDGIPYWDTGAPGLSKLGNYFDHPSDPYNDHEPVDSSAAVIAAQGFLRLGNYLRSQGRASAGKRLHQAALTIAQHVLREPYLSEDPRHEGLIVHSVYHRPNGWDFIPSGAKVSRGESSMWGDYHARELALMLQREAEQKPYYKFFL
jgi:unsaturated chondroitin disaccharide hydrolase